MPRIFSLLLIFFLFLLGMLTACGESRQVESVSSTDQADVLAGKTLYENFCLSCHGPAGKGDGPAASTLQPKPADLSSLLQLHDDEYFAARIAEGKDGTAMAAWKNVLNEAQIRQIVVYLRTLE